MTYNELKATLKKDKSLKIFPLVASSEQMILLGSIQRRELVTVIERQVGMDRRLAVKSARRREEETERRRRVKEQKIKVLQEELIKAAIEKTNVKTEEGETTETLSPASEASETDRRPSRFEVSSVAPVKGILKNSSVSDLNATVSGFPSTRHFSFASPTQSLASLSSAADKWRSDIVSSDLCPN